MNFKYAAASHTGDNRNANEDYTGVFEIDGGILAIVCDGVGIKNDINLAAKLCVEFIYKYFISSKNSDYLERIKLSLSSTNKMLCEYSEENFPGKKLITTADVLYLNSKNAYWGHVGDSRIYNIKNGRLHRMTKDHSLVQKLIDEGFLTLKEAEYRPDKSVIVRALGENENVDFDLSKMQLHNFDKYKFLICTDGVSNVVSNKELQQLMKKYGIEESATQLSELIKSRKAPDDYSFIIVGSE